MGTCIQQELADFISDCDMGKIGEHAVTDIKYRVLDWLGCAVVGRQYEQCAISRDVFSRIGGVAEATMIGAEGLYPVPSAAMVNGIIGHVSEFDDGHRKAIGHPGSVTLPVALALGEQLGVSGAAFLKSLIIGYDIFIRLGQAVNPSHYAYWHTTGTCGTFAATATAAALLKLTPEQTCNALGIAATLAGGLVASFGVHAKALNIGHACQSGVHAALLAQRGFTGSSQALAGDKGFLVATSDAKSLEIPRPTEETLLSDTAFYKVYASCGHTNSPLDAMFAILRQHKLNPGGIRNIKVETYHVSVNLTGALKARNETEAKFSLPYCIAVAIAGGQVTLAEFAPEMLGNATILDLAKKVSVVESEEATRRFPKRQARVTVSLEDGRTYSEEVMDSTDVADYPALERKFLANASSADPGKSREVLGFITGMEASPDIVPLVHYLQSL